MEILEVESRKFISNSTPAKKPQLTVKKLIPSSLDKENDLNSMNLRSLVDSQKQPVIGKRKNLRELL